jgi:cytochrome c oxidase subunit 2
VDRAVRGANSPVMTRRLVLSVALLALGGAAAVAQDQAPNRRDVALVARDHQFVPNRIEVTKDDLVRITMTSEDRPYSFAIDAYHILKRAGAGKTIVFDFRADQAGTFTFYCNLTSDAACREMKGTLVVAPK